MIDEIDELIHVAQNDLKVIERTASEYPIAGATDMMGDLRYMIQQLQKIRQEILETEEESRRINANVEQMNEKHRKISRTIE